MNNKKFARWLQLPDLIAKKSFFLFGPRATGKSFLIREQLKDILLINLLDTAVYLRLSTTPNDLSAMIKAFGDPKCVVIDEVQRVPQLLNEVHKLIEENGITFLLTGSSARKLKHGQANLLAGRAREAHLFPLVSQEIPDFNLKRYLSYGGLPFVYLSNEPEEDLNAYVNVYLKEEIQAEALVRKIPAFLRFLKTAAISNGQMLKFTEIANDTAIPVSTVREYYQILEDTFLGFLVPAYTKTLKRKAISMAKFYFFDIGVRNCLLDNFQFAKGTCEFGLAFEHFIALELSAYISYNRLRQPLTYWHSKNGQEVDFIVGDKLAIEVKTTDNVQIKHLKNLKALAEENLIEKFVLISFDHIHRQYDNIQVIHWEMFLKLLWSGKLLTVSNPY